MLAAQTGNLAALVPGVAAIPRGEYGCRLSTGESQLENIRMIPQPADVRVAQARAGFAPLTPVIIAAEDALRCASQDDALTRNDARDSLAFQPAVDEAPLVLSFAYGEAVIGSKIDHEGHAPYSSSRSGGPSP